MSDDFPSPDGHAQGWRLISREASTDRSWIEVSDMTPALLLLVDGASEWWAVAANCRQCASALVNGLTEPAGARAINGFDELHCVHCGAAHGPAVAGCACIALMVVDEEIYALPDIDALRRGVSQGS